MRFIELSHVIEHRMITYRGLPGPVITEFMSRDESRSHYSEGTEFSIGKIEMVANTGTYLDSPFHRFSTGKDISELPLESLARLSGVLIHTARNRRVIDVSVLQGKELKGKAVLIHTGWAHHWGTDLYSNGPYPFLNRDAALYLVESGSVLVGIDTYNVDDVNDGSRPAHTLLLQSSIPIIEHMCNLEQLPDSGFIFFAVPPRIKGLGSFPVRAFAFIQQE